jgi:hypothetical protein
MVRSDQFPPQSEETTTLATMKPVLSVMHFETSKYTEWRQRSITDVINGRGEKARKRISILSPELRFSPPFRPTPVADTPEQEAPRA